MRTRKRDIRQSRSQQLLSLGILLLSILAFLVVLWVLIIAIRGVLG